MLGAHQMSVRLAKPLSVTGSAIHVYERVSFPRLVVPAYHRLRLRAPCMLTTHAGETLVKWSAANLLPAVATCVSWEEDPIS